MQAVEMENNATGLKQEMDKLMGRRRRKNFL